MPVEVRKYSPRPTPPPTTYDITGLTYDQAALIRDLLGLVSTDDVKESTYPIYLALYDVLPGEGTDYQFTGGVIPEANRLSVIVAHPRG